MEWFRTRAEARVQSSRRRQDRPRVRALLHRGSLLDRLSLAFASSLFTGFLPKGGGYGALAGALVASAVPSIAASSIALVAVAALGTLATARIHRAASVDDPSEVTIDEVAGAWLACLLSGLSGWALALPFALFCLFDATKPFPANVADRSGSAVGVMADDLVAGLYGGILARGIAIAWAAGTAAGAS